MLTQLKSFLNSQGKGLLLLLTMVLGAMVPQAHTLSFLIQYFLMAMLFFAFLDIEFRPRRFQKSIIWVLLANVALAFASYLALVPFHTILALAAFMTAIAPTAIAAPVITGFIQGEVEYVVAALLVTNVSSAIIIPSVLPFLLGADVQISVWDVLQPVLVVMFAPMLLAYAVTRLPAGLRDFFRKGKVFSFPIWLVNLFLISANAANYLLREDQGSTVTLVAIALISLLLCIINFGVGAWLGGPCYWQEASQSLGQKNLSFVIWIALTFINPLVAMGPVFYILYHHVYNSWSIYRFEKRQRA